MVHDVQKNILIKEVPHPSGPLGTDLGTSNNQWLAKTWPQPQEEHFNSKIISTITESKLYIRIGRSSCGPQSGDRTDVFDKIY